MGEFKAGTWVTLLSLYFFGFFLVIFSFTNAAMLYEDTDISGISVTDPGFQTLGNAPEDQGDACTGTPHFACTQLFGLSETTNDSACNGVSGCLFVGSTCTGVIQETCAPITNQSFCQHVGCTFTSFTTNTGPSSVAISDSVDWSSVKNTIGIMTGFNATLGAPALFAFIFSFLFFWIPFFMLAWAIYMGLPFVH